MIGEALFVLALVFSWVNSAIHVVLSDRPLYAFAPSTLAMSVRAQRVAWVGAASVGFAAALWLWAASGAPRLGAVAVLAVLLAIRQVETRQWPGDIVVRLGKYVPAAACLLGWLVAASIVGALGASEAAAAEAGWEGAAGVMAALYPLAALSKLQKSGWRWVTPAHHALMIAERAYTGPAWVRAARRHGARSRALCAFVGLFGFLAEAVCVLYVFPELRLPVTLVVLALHAGILLYLGYVEPEWLLAMIAITLVTGSW